MSEPRHRILHCLRAPVGGLFRHVRDLAREQASRGHSIGVVCDRTTGDALTERHLADLAPALSLGLHRIAMSREIGPADIGAIRAVREIAVAANATILHGHGAKGGAYARIVSRNLKRSRPPVACFYTPHGGSLHYDPASLKGRIFMTAERRLLRTTDGLIFESRYAADTFAAKVGAPGCAQRVIHNGILPHETRSVTTEADAADVLFVGELRHLKGVDVLLEALARVAMRRPLSALIVGAGPDEAMFRNQAASLGLGGSVTFAGAMPAGEAFRRGRMLVLPSRAESFPYVALEAAGAGLPLVATSVGGIPEIVEGTDTALVAPEDADALARAILANLASPLRAADRAGRLQRRMRNHFSVAEMTRAVLEFYDAARTATSPAALLPRIAAALND